MKRLTSIIIICSLLSITPLVYGQLFIAQPDITITSGIVKDYESTFDMARTITGTAEKNTLVVISVYQEGELDENGEPKIIEKSTYEFTVGVSGIFSQVIELPLGENHIRITATIDEHETEKNIVINRKDIEIKLQLEQGIALPGKKK